jgi:outer membrane protein TolC
MRRLAVILASWLALVAAGGSAQAARYTLADLERKVANDYPGVLAARETIKSAEASLRAAQFMWLPSGDATLFGSGSPNVRCLPPVLPNPANPSQPDPNQPDPNQVNPNQLLRESNCLRTTVVDLNTNAPGSSYYDTAPIHGLLLRLDVYLNQTLFSFGKIEAAILQARAGLDAARANLEREQAEAVYQANRAFWGVKAAGAAVDTINEGVEKLKEWIAKIDEQINGKNPSRYTESDLARMKVALAFARTQLFDQQRNLTYARSAIKFLTGDPDADVDDSELDLVDPQDPDPLPEWLARAERQRPEIKTLKATAQTARGFRVGQLAQMLPDLTFTSYLGVGYASSIDTPQNYFFNRPNYVNATFGLSLHEPLDLGLRAARWLQARHDEQATVARNQQSMVTYSTEIAKAYEDYVETRGRAKETARGEKVSRGWYINVDTNLSSGLYTDGRELVEALQNYFTFRLRNFQALFDANVALAWLKRTTGTASK